MLWRMIINASFWLCCFQTQMQIGPNSQIQYNGAVARNRYVFINRWIDIMVSFEKYHDYFGIYPCFKMIQFFYISRTERIPTCSLDKNNWWSETVKMVHLWIPLEPVNCVCDQYFLRWFQNGCFFSRSLGHPHLFWNSEPKETVDLL